MYNVKLPAVTDHINTSMASCHCRTADHNFITFLLNYAPLCQVRVLGCSVLQSVDFTCSWRVFVNGRGARHKLSPIGLVLLGWCVIFQKRVCLPRWCNTWLNQFSCFINFFYSNAVHKFPVYGTIKCYCIVLHCTVLYCPPATFTKTFCSFQGSQIYVQSTEHCNRHKYFILVV